jgi:hypothetical protein
LSGVNLGDNIRIKYLGDKVEIPVVSVIVPKVQAYGQ